MAKTSSSLPLKLCLGWGIGTFGVSVMFNSVTILMQRFATDFLGIAAITWGYLFLGSKIYDALTDPIMGVISDRTQSNMGRRRPYLLLGAVICVCAFYALFHSPSVTESNVAIPLMFLSLLLYSTGYTIFNVPYIAMLAEMTDNYKERARLVSFRVYAVGLGTMVGLALGPWLVGYLGGGRAGHQLMSLIYGAIILSALLACFMLTKDAPQTQSTHAQQGLSFSESLRLIWSNKPFMRIIGLKITQLASVAVNQTLLVYFVVHVLHKDYQFLGVYGLIAALCTMLGPWLCLRVMHLFDKRSLYLIATVVHAIGMLSWLLSGPQEANAIIIFRGAILGFTAGAMIMMGQAMLPDAISYETLKTGLRREGIYSGIYTSAEKLAFAGGGALTAFILGFSGYVSSTTGSAEQSANAIYAIYFCAGVLPAILAAISCLFLIGYDLSESKLDELRQQYERNASSAPNSSSFNRSPSTAKEITA